MKNSHFLKSLGKMEIFKLYFYRLIFILYIYVITQKLITGLITDILKYLFKINISEASKRLLLIF